MNTLPPEIQTQIGAWLPDNADFANLAVALGVKWEPATQAQRMIRKYGWSFLSHIQLADERVNEADETQERPYTTTQRGYLNFSGDQLRFYKYLVKRLPDVAAREVERLIKSTDDDEDDEDYDFAWEERLQPFLRSGFKLQALTPGLVLAAVEWHPALLELLLETGQLDVTEPVKVKLHSYHTQSCMQNCVRLLRWGAPVDVDGLLLSCLERSNKTYEFGCEDLPLRFARHGLIRELLIHGANPNLACGIPEDPDVITLMMLHGADPDTNGWFGQVEHLWSCSIYKLECWVKNGWFPKETRDPLDGGSPAWFFRLFIRERNEAVAEMLLDHFGRKLLPCAGITIKDAMSLRWFRFVDKMVQMFPEIDPQLYFK
ncbi:hypothetical protein HK102_009108 [Quaeritorhiza haematococci]|nr:hypothetical protein HK102_009108 [Quaeritorhiza haematococci]